MANIILFLSSSDLPDLSGLTLHELIVALAMRALFLQAFPRNFRRTRRLAFALY